MLQRAEANAEPVDVVRAHFVLSLVGRQQGESSAAAEHGRTALALARELGASPWIAWCLLQVSLHPSDRESASPETLARVRESSTEALARFQAMGSEWGQVNALRAPALIAATEGEVARAAQLTQQSLDIRQAIDDRPGIVDILIGTAELAAARAALNEAAELLAAAAASTAELGYGLGGIEAASVHKVVDDLRRRLDADTFAQAWNRGSHMPPHEAIQLARTLLTNLAADRGPAS
jgi:hypothetical protein